MNSRGVVRLDVGGAANALSRGDAALFRRLVHIAAHGEQHGGAAGKVDFDVHFLTVAAARGHELAVDALQFEDIGREAQLEFGRKRCRVAE